MRFIARELGAQLLRASRGFPALIVTGPRRAGKTTLLRHLFPRASYVLLEDPAVTARNWRAISDFVSVQSKVIVTCRTGYFKSMMEEAEIFGVVGQYGDVIPFNELTALQIQNVARRIFVKDNETVAVLESTKKP